MLQPTAAPVGKNPPPVCLIPVSTERDWIIAIWKEHKERKANQKKR